MCEKTEFIIRSRIQAYKDDIKAVENKNFYLYRSDKERVLQDKVIIQELEKILTGKGLERLSYV